MKIIVLKEAKKLHRASEIKHLIHLNVEILFRRSFKGTVQLFLMSYLLFSRQDEMDPLAQHSD